MKNQWVQPSLSREFALLSVAILFILFLVSVWVTYITYESYSDKVITDLKAEAKHIDVTLTTEIESANYLIASLGKQILIKTRNPDSDLTGIATLLKSFDSRTQVYHVFLWTNERQEVVISSAKGILDKPVDVSDRDYIKQSISEPWRMQIGRPIEGRVSGRWVIPIALGLTDNTGRYVGTISISMDINDLSDQISKLIRRRGVSFAITSESLIPLMQVSPVGDFISAYFPNEKMTPIDFDKKPAGLVNKANMLSGARNFAYYQKAASYPYLILLGYDNEQTGLAVRGLVLPKLVQISVVAFFLISFLWILRARIIRPVEELTEIASGVARGEPFTPLPKGGPTEIMNLSYQIRRISDFIVERQLMEDELRNKMFMLKKSKEKSDVSNRGKSEFLSYISQELKAPITGIVGFAQVMKDQLYGPIENKKYRQYAADIYKTGTSLLTTVQDLNTLSRAESDLLELREKPLDVASVAARSQRFIGERLQTEKLNLRVRVQENLPRLIADEFCIQQILVNLLHYTAKRSLPGDTLVLDARLITEDKESPVLAFVICNGESLLPSNIEIHQTSAEILPPPTGYSYKDLERQDATPSEDMNILLARMLLVQQRCNLEVRKPSESGIVITICIPHDKLEKSAG